MLDINSLVRENMRHLQPYSSARNEFKGSEGVFLDANENPFGIWNRYPDPHQSALKKKLGELKSIPVENIFIGNGSDEVIDLIFRIFCRPGIDKALAFTPTYGMYEVSAAINEVTLLKRPLDENFQIDFDDLESYLVTENLKLIFICSPNNPTGNRLYHIDRVLEKFKGIVVVDEAYIDFSTAGSWADKIDLYPNLVIAQTFSKAWGLAAARVGVAYANPQVIAYFKKIKPPYNVSTLNQQVALKALTHIEIFEKRKKTILQQREWLRKKLIEIPLVKKIYPSDANFLLVEVADAGGLYQRLVSQHIITRNRHGEVRNCIRITVGTSKENRQLIAVLKSFST